MKKPFWKFFVAGVAIYLGLLGTVSSFLNIASVLTVNTLIQTAEHGQSNDGRLSNDHEDLDDPIRHISENPTWTIALNMINLGVSVFYQVGALALIMKPLGYRIFYTATLVSILGTIVKIIPFFGEHQDLLVAVLLASTPGLVIDLILAGIVYVGTRYERNKPDRSIFQDPTELLPQNSPSLLRKVIPKITGGFAALCVGVLPFWILGVPGVDNNFARGWDMGLNVILYYPIAWIIVFGVSWGLKNIIAHNRHESLNIGVAVCLALLLGLALLRLGQAFHFMAL